MQIVAFLLLVVLAVSNVTGFFDDFKSKVPEDNFDDSNSLIPGDKGVGFFQKVLKPTRNVMGELNSESNTERQDGKPGFCGKRNCPSFVVMNKTKHYELRCYRGALWVSTKGFGFRKQNTLLTQE